MFKSWCHAVCGLLVVVATVLGKSVALAARPGDVATKWAVNDDNPSASVPSVEERNKNPLEFGYFLQDLLARTQMAYEVENWEDVVKYNEALATAVPDVARPFSALCVAYAKLEKFDAAAAYCGKATTLKGARVFDHLRLLDLTLRKSKLTPEDIATADASLSHLREHAALNPQPLPGEAPAPKPVLAPGQRPETGEELVQKLRQEMLQERRKEEQAQATPEGRQEPEKGAAPGEEGDPAIMHLPTEIEVRNCKLAALTGADGRLTSCIEALQGYKADGRLLLPFRWAQALLRKDEAQAEELMKQVASLGLSPATLRAMQNEQDEAFGNLRRFWTWGIGIACAGVLLLGYRLARRRRVRAPLAPAQQATIQV